MTERRTVTLKPGDVFRETFLPEGAGNTHLLEVQDVNTDGSNQDYLWAYYELRGSDVPNSTTIFLNKGEKQGKKATLPKIMVFHGNKVKIEKVKAPKGTRWSYK